VNGRSSTCGIYRLMLAEGHLTTVRFSVRFRRIARVAASVKLADRSVAVRITEDNEGSSCVGEVDLEGSR